MFGCVLESPHRGDSNTHPKHMILWRNIENPFLSNLPTQDFPHFYYMLGGNQGSLLYGDVSVMETSPCPQQNAF